MRVFISHSSEDNTIADPLVLLCRTALNLSSDDIRYTSSVGYGLETGESILEALRKDVLNAPVVIGLITPNSLKSIWAIFELGARWGSEKRFFPLCASGVTPHNLPEPIKSLSALDCTKKDQLLRLLEDVSENLDQKLENASTFMQQVEKLAELASHLPPSKDDSESVQTRDTERIPTESFPKDTTHTESPYFSLDWADPMLRKDFVSPYMLSSLILEPLLPEDTFEPAKNRGPYGLTNYPDPFDRPNPDYSAELIAFAYASAFVKPLGLRLRNNDNVTSGRVRFEGKIAKQEGLCVIDNMVPFPNKSNFPFSNLDYSGLGHESPVWIDLSDSEGCYEVTVEFGDIRPQEDVWSSNTLWFGSRNSCLVRLEGKLLGDNIGEPLHFTLAIQFETNYKPMTEEDVRLYKHSHFERLGLDEE